MKRLIYSLLVLLSYFSFSQTTQDLINVAQQFPAMPEGSAALAPLNPNVTPIVTSAGSPASDLEWTMFDAEYLDGETDGYDTFFPVDPSHPFPGANKIKFIEVVSKLHTSELYGGANGARIILGVDENPLPFFTKGPDGVDNDYYVIQHFDYRNGHIQLRGTSSDYRLIHADETTDGVNTTGWYLFYTASGTIDLIAFIFDCDDVSSDQIANFTSSFCNTTGNLDLNDTSQFRYAQPVSTAIAVNDGLVQFGTAGKDVVSGSTLDPQGNIYLYGLTDGNASLASSNKIFVSKTLPDGSQDWYTELPVTEGTLIFDAVADSNFIYAAGRTFGSLPGFTNQGAWDGIILKIDTISGAIVDTVQYGGVKIDGFGNITLDDNGHIYVSGAGAPLTNTGLGDPFFLFAKFSQANLNLIWSSLEPVLPTSDKVAEAWGGITYIPDAIPGNGKILLGGWFLNQPNGADGFLALYNNLNASSPSRLNTQVISSSSGNSNFRADWIWGSTADTNGNIYAVGYTTGDLDGTHQGDGDAFIVKYDSSLNNPIFKQLGSSGSERYRRIEVDATGDIFVSGHSYGNLFGANIDSQNYTADIIIQKLNNNLQSIATNRIGTALEDRGYLSINNNYVYIGGMTEGSLVDTNLGSFDGFIATLSLTDLSVVNSTLTVNSESSTSFTLYPNPASDTLHIQIKNNKGDDNSAFAKAYTYNIYDMLGRQVLFNKTLANNGPINVSNLKSGSYLIKIENQDSHQTLRFIKNK